MIAFHRSIANALLFAIVALPSMTLGQETEPNNSCLDAQDVGTPDLPFAITGSLDSLEGAPDIDFFRITGVAGDLIRAEHQGASSGNGTLTDPFLGLFDADCNFVDLNDDAVGLDSRLIFSVPDSGTYVLAATVCCDGDFLGGGQGTYQLTVSPAQVADSIVGRVVDARDQAPLPGDNPPFAFVELLRCTDGSCFDLVNFQPADGDGNFRFDSDFSGNPLLAGTYQLNAFADGFETFTSDPFAVAENQALDLGAIALTPFQLIGSVSGRLVDALDGAPLSGFDPTFGLAELQRCEDFDCFPVVGLETDEDGLFRFDGAIWGLGAGSYRIAGFANDYQPTTTDQFNVGASEDFDVGDVPLTPIQIQFGAIEACEIPPGGGLCEYGIELINRGPGRFKGQAWSTVDIFGQISSSIFQTGIVGTTNPMPEQLNLAEGQTKRLRFQLDVPAGVPDGVVMCARVTVGRNPNPQFDDIGTRFLFCAITQLGDFELLSDKELRKRIRESRQRRMR